MSGDMLNDKEATQYDRQIRLWGLDAQKRIRNTRVLFVGLRGFGVETCKNIVLAGVKSLTLMDDAVTTDADLSAQFFLGVDDVGKNRAEACLARLQALNPLVEVTAETGSPQSLTVDILKNYDVVCLTGGDLSLHMAINELTRQAGVRFFAGDVFGMHGYFFSDQLEHHYLVDQPVVGGDDTEPATKQAKRSIDYCSLTQALATSFKGIKTRRLPMLYIVIRALDQHRQTGQAQAAAVAHVCSEMDVDPSTLPQDLLDQVFSAGSFELNPAAAILGGVLGGEIIKVVSGKDEPVDNIFLWDATTSNGTVYRLGSTAQPKPVEAAEVIEL
eukprot:m.32232 g.32232  ORF g.32232 m.32232 type:complete len:329 (+) comp12140_c0_seq1:45-1031(+)